MKRFTRDMRWLRVLVVGLAACSSGTAATPNADACASLPWHASFGHNRVLQVAIADTDEERQHGLMGVTQLPDNHGMAFVWQAPTDGSFWMKDTLIPLSVAFIDANGKVVSISDMQPCTSDPCPTYAATDPYVTAIEANQSWFEDHHVRVGDEVGLSPTMCS